MAADPSSSGDFPPWRIDVLLKLLHFLLCMVRLSDGSTPSAWARGDSGPLYGDLVALLEECRWSWCGSALLVASLPIARRVFLKCSVPMASVCGLLLMCELQFVASGVLEWLPYFLAGSGESSSALPSACRWRAPSLAQSRLAPVRSQVLLFLFSSRRF